MTGSKVIYRPKVQSSTVQETGWSRDFQWALDRERKRKRVRRWLLAGIVVLLILLGSVIALASIEEPTFTVQSMSVDRISIPQRAMFIDIVLSVDNPNSVSATLLGVEGEVISGETRIGDFYSEEEVEIPANSNFTVQLEVRVTDVPLPLPAPVLIVNGKATLRVFLGITYHFTHAIPLTYDPDQSNSPPVASIDAPRLVRRDKPAFFDGSNSYDPDGKVVGWSWDFGDGQRAEGPQVDHSFLAAGVYQVSLTVIDQMGERDQVVAEVRVLPL